jgi:hypothetical protein
MAHIIFGLAIFFTPLSSTAVSVPAVVAAPNLINRGLHSVLQDFIHIICACTLVSDLLLILELI